MDAAMLWLNLGLLVAGAGAAAIAWWQAIEASRERYAAQKAAAEAVDTQREIAAALARSADAQEAIALSTRAEAWGPAVQTGAFGWSVQNSSGRKIHVLGVDVEPSKAAQMLEIDVPVTVDSADVLLFNAFSRGSIWIRSVKIRWSFIGNDGEEQETVRTLR